MTSFALRNLTLDVGLLALRAGPHALCPFFRASQSLAFALFGRALAFVRALLSFVRQLLAVVRNFVALVGDPIPSAGQPLAHFEFSLALNEGAFTLVERVSPALQLLGRHGAMLCGHSSP